MAAKDVIDSLKNWFSELISDDENTSASRSFAEAFGLGSLEDLIQKFSFQEDDEKWQQLYAKRKPTANYGKLRKVRQRIAYLSAGLRDSQAFYLSGDDNHVITDVDVMRISPHTVKNAKARLETIEVQLQD